MTSTVEPLSITISPRGGQSYKSISSIEWSDIPGFAILTGKNGAGKTQFLEILAFHFSGTSRNVPYLGSPLPVVVTLTGSNIAPHEVSYIPSGGRFSPSSAVSIGNLATARATVPSIIQQAGNPHVDIYSKLRGLKLSKLLEGHSYNLSNPDSLKDILPDDFGFMLDSVDVTSGLAYVFVAHRFKMLQALERGTPGIDKNGSSLGHPPWEIINELLSTAGFPYEVISPLHTDIVENYSLRIKDIISGRDIAIDDLSSGEKVIMQAALWLYSSSKPGEFPKLLLLDEPDAHLHPSMTLQFVSVLSKSLVEKYGVRVVMTTHSPSTVALAPDGAVFEMTRGGSIINKVVNKSEILSVLSSGLLTVSRATKYCFVEDEDDVIFYDTIRNILSNFGPTQDPMSVAPSPSIVFIPASVGSGTAKIAGGCTIIQKWVDKLNEDPLDRIFLGIIDRDVSNAGKARIFVLGRYSFENYLLDPINLYCLLSEEGRAPPVASVNLTSGDEHLLRKMSHVQLQAISDAICSLMEGAEQNLRSSSRKMVEYTTQQSITVPSWVIDKKGHDLLPIAQTAFGGARLVNPPRLLKSLRRMRLIPKEMAQLLRNIQNY